MSPRVSIIVRTKDRLEFLARALADIASQSFTDFEVIVVNDQGISSAVERVVGDSSLATRTVVVHTESPGGRCAAANSGVRASNAPYVVLHDDDDLWHPAFLERTVALLDVSPSDAGVMTATEIIYEQLIADTWTEVARAPYWKGMTGVTFTSLLEINRAVPIAFLYRRDLHQAIGGYDETLDAVEDWDFYLRVSARHPIAFLGGTALAYWTQRPTATGAEGNSMYELSSQHERDDLIVRDRALREWVTANGPGLPLYLAWLQKEMRSSIETALEERDARLLGAIEGNHPVWSRVRRLRRRLRRNPEVRPE